jgi:glucosamine-6-phosphate deaminase
MRVIILKDYKSISEWVAQYIHLKITNSQNLVLGLPSGSTPLGVYKNFIKLKTSFKNVTTFNMDEYIGLSPQHEQSYNYFMNNHLFNHIDINRNSINIPNGISKDIEKEFIEYENKIKRCGGIDLFLCGIGSDGHMAFNEPGSSFQSVTRLKTLTTETVNDNSRFFDSVDKVPKTAITVGINTIMEAREIIIMANGIHKANAIKQLIEGNISTQFPCTISQNHKNAIIVIDEKAASELKYKTVLYYKQLQKNIDILGKTIPNKTLSHYINSSDNILITSPHPDDDVIGMGGLMNLLPNKTNTKIVYMTNGQGGIRNEDNYGPYTRIKEAISSVKVLGYNKNQVLYPKLPFYTKTPRKLCNDDIQLVNTIIDDIEPDHIFICSDPDPNNTHLMCLELLKKCKIGKNTKIWLYKSAWQKWPESKHEPNFYVCIDRDSFKKKLLAIDMHISQINPLIYKDNEIKSFKDIVIEKNKSTKYFNQYVEKFYICSSSEFKKLKSISN